MSRQTPLLGLGLLGAGLIALTGAGACSAVEPNAPEPQIDCSANGAKLFAPPTSAEAVCDRFAAALRSRPLPSGRLTVELDFASNGVASARVSVARDGRAAARSRFALAISDRGFALPDLDRLAADVAAGLSDGSSR